MLMFDFKANAKLPKMKQIMNNKANFKFRSHNVLYEKVYI